MTTWRKVGYCLIAAIAAFGAWAYEDDYISVDDETVVKKDVDGHAVYVFTTPSSLNHKLTLLQPMVLDQYLIVGGGGAGGNIIGGGGGGGGVVYVGSAQMTLGARSTLLFAVGAGGMRSDTAATRSGGSSILDIPVVGLLTAYGGGGGNGWNSGLGESGASTGGATSNKGGSVRPVIETDPPQGNVGGACKSGGSGLGGGGGGYSEPGQASYSATRDILDGDGNMLIEGQSYYHGGKGGDGFPCEITGERHVYGSGGGGAAGWANNGGIEIYNLPGEGGEESGGRGGHTTLDHGNVNLAGEDGVSGLGGGGGGGGHNNTLSVSKNAGNGGSGTVILALRPLAAGDRSFYVESVADVEFDGSPVTPKPVVRDGASAKLLVENQDYELSYERNDRVGEATVVVKGIGEYENVFAVANFFLLAPRTGGRDVFLLLGGSNMVGFGGANDFSALDLSGVDLFNGTEWVAATEPFFTEAGAACCPGASFARIVKSAAGDGQAVGVVPCAVGGSKMSAWVPGGANYSAALAKARAALADGGSVRAILWHHGEEAMTSESDRATYAAAVAAMVERLRLDLGLSATIPFIVGTVGNFTASGNSAGIFAINDAIRALPKTIPHCICVDTSDLPSTANTKLFNTESLRTLGQRWAEAYLRHESEYAGSILAVDPIDRQAISGDDPIEPEVTVRTNGVPVDASLFDVTYSATDRVGYGIATVVGKGACAGSVAAMPFRLVQPVFVAPDGTEANGGTSWADATTFAKAVELAGASGEVWMKAGRYMPSAVFTMTHAMTVRGGYAGVSGMLAAEPISEFDGGRTTDLFTCTTIDKYDFATTFERCGFVRGKTRGFTRQGRGRAQFLKCRFNDNRGTSGGLGVYFGGCHGTLEVLMRDCEFRGNQQNSQTWMATGTCIYLGNISYAFVENTLFVTNGLSFSTAVPSASPYGQGLGVAIYLSGDGSAGLSVTGCRFVCNRAAVSGTTNGGNIIHVTSSYAQTNIVRNCAFVGNELVGRNKSGGQFTDSSTTGQIVLDKSTGKLLVDGCTFAYNLSDIAGGACGVTVRNGSAHIRNSIFYGNFLSNESPTGADVHVTENGYLRVEHSLFRENSSTYVSSVEGSHLTKVNIKAGDPFFVTSAEAVTNAIVSTDKAGTVGWPKVTSNFAYDAERLDDLLGIDVHLKSSAGYFNNAGEFLKAPGILSVAVDAGDPAADYSNEPEPNGGCLNLGVYGNTAEASRTSESEPVIEGDLVVEFPTEYGQPKVFVKLGDAKGGSYNGTVTISVGTNGVWTAQNSVAGASDTTVSALAMDWYPAGAVIDVRVVLEVTGKEPVEKTAQVAVPADKGLPPFYGKGGGASVIHVRPGATGRNDGTSWQDAYDCDFHMALKHLTESRAEIWLACETNRIQDAVPIWTLGQNTKILGGFAGTENRPEERRKGAVTVIDADFKCTALAVNSNKKSLLCDGISFEHGAPRGFAINIDGPADGAMAGDVTFVGCRFVANGQMTKGEVLGRAGDFWGCYKVAGRTDVTGTLTFRDCVIADNWCEPQAIQANWSCGTGGLYLHNWKRVVMEGCSFSNNGLRNTDLYSACGSTSLSAAINDDYAPLTLVNCTFMAHRTFTRGANAGLVYVGAGSAGSVFTNCLWSGNCMNWWSNQANSNYGGCIVVATGDAESPVEIVNSTFFGNIVNGLACAAGVTVASGRANVRNSIFTENVLGRPGYGGAEDLSVLAGAEAEATYTLFASKASVTNAETGVLRLGDGVIFGDAKTVTTHEAVTNLIVKLDNNNPKAFDLARIPETYLFNVHLRGRSGYLDEKTGKIVRFGGKSSPAIDAGDPKSDSSNEPHPNGHRVNMGAYGNTPWATMSKGGTMLLVR